MPKSVHIHPFLSHGLSLSGYLRKLSWHTRTFFDPSLTYIAWDCIFDQIESIDIVHGSSWLNLVELVTLQTSLLGLLLLEVSAFLDILEFMVPLKHYKEDCLCAPKDWFRGILVLPSPEEVKSNSSEVEVLSNLLVISDLKIKRSFEREAVNIEPTSMWNRDGRQVIDITRKILLSHLGFIQAIIFVLFTFL